MQIDQIPLDRLSVSKANMRAGRKPPDISDILPSIIRRGVVSPLFVRPDGEGGCFEIVAGKRRYFASLEAAKQDEGVRALPCIVIGEGDDAEALEISMIENMLRQDPDPVTQWESFTRLVKEGRAVDDIAATFALTELQVKRILALGNLLPRIREACRAGEIDDDTVRHLTLASKAQQRAWLALLDDLDGYAPRGAQLKAWLFGGGAIATSGALFDLADYKGQIVTDLFGETGYFADADAFWAAQNAAIDERKAAYLEAGWSGVEIVPPGQSFSSWEYEKTPKRKGGRVYVAVNHRGEVTFHEGYLTTKEARRLRKAEVDGADSSVHAASARPELTSALTSYVDLHRHAVVRAELAKNSGTALRVMVAHAICGSRAWSVQLPDTTHRNAAIAESVETCSAETDFDARRRKMLALLGFDGEDATVVRSRYGSDLVPVLTRLLELPDETVMQVLAVVMAETLDVAGDAIEVIGPVLGIDMADHWQPDEAFFAALRDREVLTALLAEVGGTALASANAKEKGSVIKGLIADHLTGANDRPKVERWVPRWMRFPPAAYTERGGVGTVAAARRARWLAEHDLPAYADAPQVEQPVSGEPKAAVADEAATDASDRLAA